MIAPDEIPKDPCLWTDEHMLHVCLHRLVRDEKIVPAPVLLGVWFSGLFDEKSRAIYDLGDHCVDSAGIAIPGIVLSMVDSVLAWFRDTPQGAAAMARLQMLMEKPIYVENWQRKT